MELVLNSLSEHKGPVQVTQVKEDMVMVLMDGKNPCPVPVSLSRTLPPRNPEPLLALPGGSPPPLPS